MGRPRSDLIARTPLKQRLQRPILRGIFSADRVSSGVPAIKRTARVFPLRIQYVKSHVEIGFSPAIEQTLFHGVRLYTLERFHSRVVRPQPASHVLDDEERGQVVQVAVDRIDGR